MAGENSDLFQALNMFKEGVSQYQTSQAVNEARSQLDQINTTEKNKDLAFQKSSIVGRDLALRLTGAGASAERVQAAVGGLVPSASAVETNASQAEMQQKNLTSEEKRAFEHNQTLRDIAGLKNTAGDAKQAAKDMNEMQTKFEKMPQVKPLLTALPTLQDASNKMHENAGKFGSTAITNLVQMGIVKASVARVTEKELAAANESPSAAAKLKKQYGLQMTGEVPTNVQDFWTKIVDQQLADSKKQLRSHVASYSQSNPKVDATALQRGLNMRHNLTDPRVQAAEAYLQANPDDADASALRAKIERINNGQE